MIEATGLGKQTFDICESLFLKLPTSCELDGQCDTSVALPISSEDLSGLEAFVEGTDGNAVLEVYSDGNSFTVDLYDSEGGMLSLILLSDGQFSSSKLPGENSPDYAVFLERLKSIMEDEDDDNGDLSELSEEMATALATLAGRLVDRVLWVDLSPNQ